MKRSPSLFLIYNTYFRNYKRRLDYLIHAAQKLSINPVLVNAEEFDFTSWKHIEATKRDMFYNVTPFSHEIENIFIHKGLTSFFSVYNKINYLFSSHQFDLSLINANIPVPKTILKATNDRKLLRKYVKYVGGFPLILKVTGGTLGIGVVKIESWENLISTADMLASKDINFQLKEYIPNRGTIRAIVLGNEVICSINRINSENEFRCSSPDKKSIIEPFNCSGEIEEIAVRTTQAVNFEFTGIDIIEGPDGKPNVLEVNYPHDFTIPADFTGTDVALLMVQYLYEKSTR